MTPEITRVLFLCGENSCRSQIGEAYMRALGGEQFEVFSAGSVATRVNPLTYRVMTEDGIDISSHTSKAMSIFADQAFDIVITVCQDDAGNCPVFSGEAGLRLHWPFEDPGAATGTDDEVLVTFRRVRDAIKHRISEFLQSEYDDGKIKDFSSRR